jgi:hypothetical protein
VRKVCGKCAESVRKVCGKCAENVKCCGKCAESVRNIRKENQNVAESVRKVCGIFVKKIKMLRKMYFPHICTNVYSFFLIIKSYNPVYIYKKKSYSNL